MPPETSAADSIGQRLLRRVERERAARKQAEALLEAKSLELYESNVALRNLAQALEARIGQRTEELQQALDLANSAQRAKDQFLATMSHEIRTPMNAVIGLAALLRDTPLDARQHQYLSMLQASGEHLLALINDVLDFSKIEAGRLEIEWRPMQVEPALELVRTITEPQARAKGLGFEIHVDAAVPASVLCDELRWRQVLINLVGNAIKFTTAGSVAVRFGRVGGVADGAGETPRLFCEVRDTGIGIAAEAQARIFEPFLQADGSTTRTHGGTGLGLAISRRIAQALGGSLTLSSEPGRGSTFRLEWPLRQVETTVDATASVPAQPADPRQLRILLVEDNPINQLVANGLLEKAGCSADLAADGLEAVEKALAGSYDLILMDMQMPRLDGLGATRRIRGLPLAHQPAIVAMTANAFEEDRQQCLAAGMNDFLSKPLSFETFKAALARAAGARVQAR
jgi:signal transduction histidine kinase/ActR/RegA family two-component response regulator